MDEKTAKIQKSLVDALLGKRAIDVVSMDVGELTPIADSFVIASGNSDVHMNALVNTVTDCLDAYRERYRVEGATSAQWTLIDAGSVVTHIFSVKAREFYKVERIWGDAKTTRYGSRE